MSLDIKIPVSLRDIPLYKWQKYSEILKKNKDAEDTTFLNLKTLEIFCDLKMKDIHDIPLTDFDEILEHISQIFTFDTPRVNHFRLRDEKGVEVEFGLIPNLDKMTYGEYRDLEDYIYDEKNLHRAMAVLYRPLMYKKKDRYMIHPYKGTDEMAEIMKSTPLDVVFGVRVFFYSLAKKLGVYTLDYTLQQLLNKKEANSEHHSEKNGEDIKHFIHSHREMLAELMKLQEFHSTNV